MRRSLRSVLALILCASPISGAVLAGDVAPVDDVVRLVQARLDSTSDFTARVQHELVVASAGRTLAAQGTVAFKRPGKMRWDLRGQEEQIIVADGTTLWFYQPEDEQVIRSPFETAFRSATPVSFLTGVGKIRDDFEASLGEPQDGEIVLVLVPRVSEGELGRLRLTVDPGSHDIVGAEIRGPLGNLTRLRFSDRRRNIGLDDSLFEFQVPPGVDLIDAPIGVGNGS